MLNNRKKGVVSGWIVISIAALSFLFHAYSTGITGKTLKNGNGCECHSPTPFPEVSVVISGPDTLLPGEQAVYTITMTGGELVRGGTNIAASSGILAPISTDLRFEADELTHVQPKIPDAGAVTFQFNYTAPAAAGTQTLYANGNSVNFNGDNTGDKWNFALNKTITVAAPPAAFALSVNIINGWNMVSIPGMHPDNQNVSTWWINKDPGAGVFKFNAGYQAVTAAVPGTGYWMKHIGSQTYNTGDEWPAGILYTAHTPLTAAAGWNLIGGYEESVPAGSITTTPPGLITGSVFKYQGGYVAATTLDPGYGYWIKLSSAGQINIPSGADNSGVAAKNPAEGLGKIIITDNGGKSYTLYTARDNTDLDQFELPPAPPQGIFDIRYSTNRYAERLGSAGQDITMTGVEYPVSIKAEGVNIIVSDETGKPVASIHKGDEVSLNTMAAKLRITENILPQEYLLGQNYPNPFNPSTSINFSIPEDANNVQLLVYNSLGEKVAELVNSSLPAGAYNYSWDAGSSASGLYICQLVTEKFVSTIKMVLLK